jgi:cell division protein FtsL
MSRVLPREWYGASIRNYTVRRERARFRGRSALGYLGVAAILLLALLLYFWPGIQVISIGYEIDQLQKDYRSLMAEKQLLEVELASLQNLRLVDRVAEEKLGLAFPDPGQVVVVVEPAPPKLDPVVAEPPREKPPRMAGERLLVLLRKMTKTM